MSKTKLSKNWLKKMLNLSDSPSDMKKIVEMMSEMNNKRKYPTIKRKHNYNWHKQMYMSDSFSATRNMEFWLYNM